jgi:hypothetical protein
MTSSNSKREDFIEIKRGMRSFAFLRLQATISHLANLLTSVELYNEFPHTMKHDAFFKFAYGKYQKRWQLEFEDENPADYVMRLDLGRNQEFLHELAFLHLVNSFIIYCSDILSVAALGSPEKFDADIRTKSSRLLNPTFSSHELKNEIGIIIASRIIRTPYSDADSTSQRIEV